VVLLDAGPDLREQALRAGLTRCDGIFFTHNHVDHTFGLDEVRRFNAVMKSPVHIYAEEHTLGHLRRVYQHIFDKDANVQESFVATLVPHRLTIGVPVTLHGVRFTPFRLLHGKLPIAGYRIERASEGLFNRALGAGVGALPGEGAPGASEPGRSEPVAVNTPREATDPFPLAYCTDVSGVPPETWPVLRGLRTLVLDALRHRKHPTHLTLQEAVNIADSVGAAQTYFVHMAHDLPHAETEASLPEGMHLAYDGLELG
jgi:phosphoribosyl 1,2-cyclic phosphate phosphodiesterase